MIGVRDIVAFIVQNRVLYPIVILLFTIILARVTLYLFEKAMKKFRRDDKRPFNLQVVSIVETPLIITIILGGTELAVRKFLIEGEVFGDVILTFVILILTYLLVRIGAVVLSYWSNRMSNLKGDEFHTEILPLMRSVITIVLSVLGFLLILPVWDVNISTVLASLGVVSVVLGFAFQQTLTNIFGGISLIMDNSFKKGDLIQLDDGALGEIMEINLRSTRIKNFDSETIIVPNGQLANAKIINLAQPTPTVRIKIPVSVAYGSDVDKVKLILHDALRNHSDILTMPRRVARMVAFGQSSIDFELYFYINNYRKMWQIKDEVLTQIYKDLYAEGVEIPFPITTFVPASPEQYAPKWNVASTQAELAQRQRRTESPQNDFLHEKISSLVKKREQELWEKEKERSKKEKAKIARKIAKKTAKKSTKKKSQK